MGWNRLVPALSLFLGARVVRVAQPSRLCGGGRRSRDSRDDRDDRDDRELESVPRDPAPPVRVRGAGSDARHDRKPIRSLYQLLRSFPGSAWECIDLRSV